EQTGHPRQHAELVLDQDGDDVAHGRRAVGAVAGQDLHDLVLAGELELLEPLLLHLLLGRQVELLLEGSEPPLEVGVLLVVAPELRLSLEQGPDQLLVLFFHASPPCSAVRADLNMPQNGLSTRPRQLRVRRTDVDRLERAQVGRLARREPRGAASASRSRASSGGTPTWGSPPATASPLASASPMRSPVNEPGPIDTAMPSTSSRASPASRSTRSTSSGSEAVCERDSRCTPSARTAPSRATPTAAVHVAVSSPRTSVGAYPQTSRWMSLYDTNTINVMSSRMPTCSAISRCRRPSGRRITPSMAKKARCPPSSAGIGSRFSTARLTERKASVNR